MSFQCPLPSPTFFFGWVMILISFTVTKLPLSLKYAIKYTILYG